MAPPRWFSEAVARPRTAHTVPTEGPRLHVASWNDGETGKPPLLLVHGLRAHAHWWDHIAPFLLRRRRVHALDLSGMGRSGWREHYRRQDFTDDILSVARWSKDRSPGQPLTVVGHSYGGARLLDACAQAPGLIDHAIVLDVPLPVAGGAERPRRMTRPAGTGIDRAALLGRFRLSPEQPSWAYIRSYIAERSIVAAEGGGWRWHVDPAVMTVIGGPYQQDEALRRVSVPVDIVRAGCSGIVTADMADRMAALLPRARGPHVLQGSHHHPMLDQPVALVGLLDSLLEAADRHEGDRR